VIEVIERLLGKGYELRIYDKNVRAASLVGANREFILNLDSAGLLSRAVKQASNLTDRLVGEGI